ncbi:MAG: UDP-N-acetylglucosamine 2-epimerase (non-hydrolyzing) [Candidatus Sumerlaeota bacterium]|nr:UDP-N-acetylglucosamine 2-epimerase (non-hydrolyzing) [Candidatus Sumerlaeota bacterium]
MKKKISFIFGTRPEAIKLCPLILAMRDHPDLEPHVCVTGQHRQMLDQVLEVFGIAPDVDLALMRHNQTLGELTSRAIAAIDAYLGEHKPGMILVQGDTTTVFCAALCAFYHKIPVGHVEAGLRTWNKHSPFPEEMNRVLATRLADLHFAPTNTSRDNLLKEGVPADRIFVTGNTVIDALFIALKKIKANPPDIPGLPQHLMNGSSDKPLVLITGHRRENFGGGFENICHAIAELARRFPDAHFVYPVHLNPNVREPVARILGQIKNDPSTIHTPQSALRNPQSTTTNVHLIDPLSYLPFVAMMNRATLVLTDSGGVQEEAPSLGKPVLVMRDTTERPEAVEMGTVKLVGTDAEAIIGNVSTLLTDRAAYDAMANAVNPYGDGQSVGRIIAICAQNLAGK